MTRPIGRDVAHLVIGLALAVSAPAAARAQILDKRALFARQTRWDNRDWDWFAARIPVFDSPDSTIDATYYYRWELVTKHLTYGSARTGYTFTEFIDRPFWSGAYGAISCPLGHQFAEVRWLNDASIVRQFARYWFETPGAQPRSYSNWYGAAMWEVYEVTRDSALLQRVLPYMKQQYAGWMAEHWDAAHRMFRWDGLHDGMERNINSRQTDDIDEGAEGYRPTLNSYLYGDARAIARASALFGDTATAREYDTRADSLRERVQRELWDERRQFFLHQFAHNEKNGVTALSRTYETGTYAGNPHGRELIGYVPWQFDLPAANKGYERAWRFLTDTAYFRAPYGPTTVERHDPQFFISPRCCWWSGNSWPYATTQTLEAMANLLNDYHQSVVSPADWMHQFEIYTRTQRRSGRPYIAEAANPITGSWAGHDTPYHSEHYFHSAYVNLVITGLVGLRPRADDSVVVNPLAPDSWAYFALDDVRYHGRQLSVLWDRDGTRYGRGRGLMLFVDGRLAAHAPRLGRLAAHLTPGRQQPPAQSLVNFAVNNGDAPYPWVEVSYAAAENPPTYLVDGSYWYHRSPPNRWTTIGSPNGRDTVTVDFGAPRTIERAKLYFLDDGVHSGLRAPRRYELAVWQRGRWVKAPAQRITPVRPEAHRANIVEFSPLSTSRVRVILVPRSGAALGMAELELWGPADALRDAVTEPPRDLAFHAPVSASFTPTGDHVQQVNDLQVAFTRYSRNRWSALGSPNAIDWVEIDLGEPKTVRTVELYLWGDGDRIRAPKHYSIQLWDGSAWKEARILSRQPRRPLASARNVVTIAPARASRLRVVLEHDLPAVSGLTEVVVLP